MTINLGIDLGTTNSAIAIATGGRIQVFANPRDMGRRTLPSVVAFRKERTIIGTKARQRMEKDAKNVFGVFKRKMGTSERFEVPASGEAVSPIDLSALVLKELLTFLPSEIPTRAAVITIPASFDTVQSKATEEAGKRAGFEQVSLLQEPIAASLAFANLAGRSVPEEGKWLVYDLGGGTFDVALLSIADGEMKVVDHVGDNFLGGTDFDQLIVEQIMIPRLEEAYAFNDLIIDMKSARGKYNAQFYILRQRAEELKIQLSSAEEVDVFIDGFVDEEGEEVDLEFTLTREEFNDLIRPQISGTVTMIEQLLERNSVAAEELEFVLLVGGSTFIPLVQEMLTGRLGRPLNADVDPTTCVAEGAAAYAATRPLRLPTAEVENTAPSPTDTAPASSPSIKLAYPRLTREPEETLVGKAEGDITGWTYRVLREDGGFDSGLRPLKARFFEDLPLVPDAYNNFTLLLSGPNGEQIQHDELIGINGGYAISGQPLPEDITLEVDDPNTPSGTKCLLVFEKNAVLPLRKTINRALNRNLRRDGEEDDQIRINILEGPATASPESNKKIGYLSVAGHELSRDVSRGTDVEITLQMNENRDLTVLAYLTMTGQEFEQTFTPTERHTPVDTLKYEYERLETRWAYDREHAEENDEFELLSTMLFLEDDFQRLGKRIAALQEDDATDERYQLEDLRRSIVRQLDAATVNRAFQGALKEYEEEKLQAVEAVEQNGDEADRKQLTFLRRQEADVLAAQDVERLRNLAKDYGALYLAVRNKSPRQLVDYFNRLGMFRMLCSDERLAERYFAAGQAAIRKEDWGALRQAIGEIHGLLPDHLFERRGGFGGAFSEVGGGKVGF